MDFEPRTFQFGDFRIVVSSVLQDSSAVGPNVTQLPDMPAWGVRTQGRETNAVIVETRTPNGRLIGKAMLGAWNDPVALRADSVFVSRRFRRRGLASAMYRFAAHALGAPVMPSIFQTTAGRAFWKGNDRKMILPAAA